MDLATVREDINFIKHNPPDKIKLFNLSRLFKVYVFLLAVVLPLTALW
jgi:hypothetical protein